MLGKIYPYRVATEYRYEFTSVSTVKSVEKVVLFTRTEHAEVFNLALLDVLDSGELCDKSETKNQDMRKVLATTYDIIQRFLALNRTFKVLFAGSDEKRQRLYRIAICVEIKELSKKYYILGAKGDYIEHFQPNQPYDYYIISNKS